MHPDLSSRIHRPASLPTNTRRAGSWAVALGIITTLLAIGIIKDFRHPLSDGNDTDQFEYVGYFFAKNLTFSPFPHLNLFNTQSFYPYGINQVFLDWGFERDYWYTGCYKLFSGPGPYLQYYYLYSLVLTAVGSFALLVRRYGLLKAFVVGLIVSVFNVYAVWKFPVHMNVCVGHWTTLCIVATYRLLLDGVEKRPVSLPYLLGWAWLHVQILGQELGYVAGFALTFTTLTLPVLAVVLYRQYTPRLPKLSDWFSASTAYMNAAWSAHRPQCIGWLILLLISLYLYLPLTLQIATTAWQFDFTVVPALPFWSHPLRLLIPHLPGLNTYDLPYDRWLHDIFESYGQGSPGLYLTLLTIIGWWQIRRRVALWLPVVLTLALCLLYHPVLLPTLKVFPWFSFNRHGGRASLVYPVLLCLLALSVQWPHRTVPHWTPGKLVISALLTLMLAEWYGGYAPLLYHPIYIASDDLLRYCAFVKKRPGVAVLDFPFCTIGADGVGKEEGLCPYYNQQNAVFTFRRFYDKRGVGQYFGRLYPNQIQPFLRDGWPRLLTPGRAFTQQDWQFLDNFLCRNHFAGINLYPDLLTPAQVSQFYRHYGRPVAQTHFPAAGRVEFISVR